MSLSDLREHSTVAAQGWTWGSLRPARIAAALAGDFRDLHRYRHVLRNFVVSQLKVRYQRSVLGFFWTLLNPILMLLVLYAVFSRIVNIPNYAGYLLGGMIPWQFFSASVVNGSRSLITQEYLIRKVSVQKMVFPLSEVLVAGVNMCFAMAALFIILMFFQPMLRVQLVLLPAGAVLLLMFSLGVALISMTLVTRFRDFEHMIDIFLQAFYFVCPILYKPENLNNATFERAMRFNPMTHLLAIFQDALYCDAAPAWPTLTNWMMAGGSAVLSLVIGYAVYKFYENDYIFQL